MTAFHQNRPGADNHSQVRTSQSDNRAKSLSPSPSLNVKRVCVCQSMELVKQKLWEEHFSEFGRGVHMFRTDKIQMLVALGIPESLRGELWMTLSGEKDQSCISSV